MIITIELFGNIDRAEYLEREELLRKDVRYLGTDYEFSGYDIYEEIMTGDLYATKI